MASRTAAGREGYGQVGGATAVTGLLACTSPEIAAGTGGSDCGATRPLAPDVASGQGLPPVKGSGWNEHQPPYRHPVPGEGE